MKLLRIKYLLTLLFLCLSSACSSEYKIDVPSWQIAKVQGVVEVDISKLKPGEKLEVDYKGAPVWVYRRTQEELDYISKNYTGASDEQVKSIINRIKQGANSTTGYLSARLQLIDQPTLEKNPFRSKDKEFFVFEPLGRFGCMLTEQIQSNVENVKDAWLFDPCFGQTYDLNARFLSQRGAIFNRNTGEPIAVDHKALPRTNIPPHRYTTDRTLVIGVEDIAEAPEISLSVNKIYFGLKPIDALFEATSFNDIERARAAIEEGADVTTPGGGNPIPEVSLALLRAVYYSSTEMIELLLSNGAIPHEEHVFAATIVKRHDVKNLLESFSEK